MKKRIIVISAIALILVFGLVIMLGLLKGDNLFLLTQKIGFWFRSADVTACEVDYSILTWEEIASRKGIRCDDSLSLINRDYHISDTASVSLVYVDDGAMSVTIAKAYQQLVDAVNQKYGKKLCIRSSYRTAEEQESIVQSYPSDIAAAVGASEHQTGLSLDVYIEGSVGGKINRSKAGRYVTTHGHEYGFIIRYPHGKKAITGITYEPWHIRYVGKPHAEIMYMNSLTLEEYITSFYKTGVFYEYGEYIISRQEKSDTIMIPNGCESVLISDDNTGHYFVTAKKAANS